MNSLILRHFELLREYASLCSRLGVASAEAHVRLSRARYHGIKLSPEDFRPVMSPFVTIEALHGLAVPKDHGDQDNHEQELKILDSQSLSTAVAADAVPGTAFSAEEKTGVNKSNKLEQSKDRVHQDEERTRSVENLANSLAKTEIAATRLAEREISAENDENGEPDDGTFHMHKLHVSAVKKDNPIRSIEGLPSPALRSTQQAFQDVLGIAIELGNVFAELQTVQSLLGLHETPILEDATISHESVISDDIKSDEMCHVEG